MGTIFDVPGIDLKIPSRGVTSEEMRGERNFWQATHIDVRKMLNALMGVANRTFAINFLSQAHFDGADKEFCCYVNLSHINLLSI